MPQRRHRDVSDNVEKTIEKSIEKKAEAKEVKEKETKKTAKVIKKFVNVDALNLREKPNGNVKTILKKNQVLETVKVDDIWDKVKVEGTGETGFVMSKFTTEKA